MSETHTFTGQTRFLALPQPVQLESGQVLPQVTVAYRTWGKLNTQRDNAVLICHALTGTPDADLWWRALFSAGHAFDPARDFIVCSNVLGGCYGTTGPRGIDPDTGQAYGGTFPAVSIRDMVHVQRALLQELGVARLALVVGGSLGGMQVLEWAALYPDYVDAIVPIACGARQSAWAIGFSEAQRQAICADPNWQRGNYHPARPPATGLAAARMTAMLSYRHWDEYGQRFARQRDHNGEFQAISYLRHQGDKLVRRFDAASYVMLTRAMDTHDIARGRGTLGEALDAIEVPALVVGIDSDLLYPLAEQQGLATLLPYAELAVLNSRHGHDAFLIETDALNAVLQEFRIARQRFPASTVHRHAVRCAQ
jgi:homoserine O-acetyltransferase/O-succinyltransferase